MSIRTNLQEILKPVFARFVLKQNGKDLSTNDYTDEEKARNVQSDWNARTGFGVILNKPHLSPVAISGDYNDLYNLPELPSGGSTGESSSRLITTLEIDTPIWEVQPTASVENWYGLFSTWEIKNYFVTLKDTSGTALPSGQFKLTEKIDGYAKAIDCVFTLEGHTLTENYPVDFKIISEVDENGIGAAVMKMRDAGTVSMEIPTKNPLAQNVTLYFNGKSIVPTTSGAKYIYLKDNIMITYGTKVVARSMVGKYNGTNGVLNYLGSAANGGMKLMGFTWHYTRTSRGAVGTWDELCDASSANNSNAWFTDTTAALEDFTQAEITTLKITTNKAVYLANGSVLLLEESV